MNMSSMMKVSIDDDKAYGLVLQREIALFRESRDGVDVEVGTSSGPRIFYPVMVSMYCIYYNDFRDSVEKYFSYLL
jgi:hypothetical protein